jgi:hypothetical protein
LGRKPDSAANSSVTAFGEAAFILSLGFLALAAVRLAQHALSRKYAAIATPSEWSRHLKKLRQRYASYVDREQRIVTRLQTDFSDALSEAVDSCCAQNEAKAAALERVILLLRYAIVLALLGVLLVLVSVVR